MQLGYSDYIKLVKEEYERKRINNELPRFRVQSTRSKLKEESLDVFQNRYEKKDKQTLKNFFGEAEDDVHLSRLIRRVETERFRTLDNYLKGKTEKTDDDNMELLAWLVNFRHRPWALGMDVLLNEEEIACLKEPVIDPGPNVSVEDPEKTVPPKPEGESEDISGNNPTDKPVDYPSQVPLGTVLKSSQWGTGRKRSVAMIALILVLCASGIFIIRHAMAQQTGCMYWNGDQYVPVPCDEEPNNGRVFLPLDVKKMKNFQRITREDTITKWSIGKIYYIKDNNEIDYYTYSGNYPADLNRYVKKLSRRIFEKDSVNRKLP